MKQLFVVWALFGVLSVLDAGDGDLVKIRQMTRIALEQSKTILFKK